jgi:hypothetical protein
VAGQNGGSGIVIVSFVTSALTGATLTADGTHCIKSTSGSNTLITCNSGGTMTISLPAATIHWIPFFF